ncbi:hypothetical protein Lepto7376_2194 [[Leptolyngbya] sp. PCC 7376]|nr:hypothetical protein Lepto7376_2194 [[Leptolyngbya] sp. PCC 7376]
MHNEILVELNGVVVQIKIIGVVLCHYLLSDSSLIIYYNLTFEFLLNQFLCILQLNNYCDLLSQNQSLSYPIS